MAMQQLPIGGTYHKVHFSGLNFREYPHIWLTIWYITSILGTWMVIPPVILWMVAKSYKPANGWLKPFFSGINGYSVNNLKDH